MAYGFNNETVAESTNSKQFNAGITANVTLESITFESPRKDGTGDKVLIFTFRGPEGEVYRHIEWDVQDGDEKKLENMAKRINPTRDLRLRNDVVLIRNASRNIEHCMSCRAFSIKA